MIHGHDPESACLPSFSILHLVSSRWTGLASSGKKVLCSCYRHLQNKPWNCAYRFANRQYRNCHFSGFTIIATIMSTTQKTHRWPSIVIGLCWTINFFIFIYILGQRLGFIHTNLNDFQSSASDSHTYIATDFPRTFSEADPDTYEKSITAMSFQESSAYPLFRGYSEHDINSLNGPWGGIVRIGPDKRPFLLSMWHEIHCLRVFRSIMADADYAESASDKDHHMQHCLSYLRQSILCEADVTLEPGDFLLQFEKNDEKDGETRLANSSNAGSSSIMRKRDHGLGDGNSNSPSSSSNSDDSRYSDTIADRAVAASFRTHQKLRLRQQQQQQQQHHRAKIYPPRQCHDSGALQSALDRNFIEWRRYAKANNITEWPKPY